MPSIATSTHYASLRVNTWPTDDIELDLDVSALVAGVYFELVSLSESAPPVVPTSSPRVLPIANPDFAWDIETTPLRLHTFLMDLSKAHPKVTPSAWLETLYLVQAMFQFTKDHPVIVNNFVQELELFWLRTFWNVAQLYDPDFTEDRFHALTDSRYVRCLDPSTKLILKRTMDIEATKLDRSNLEEWRVKLCTVYVDWTVEVETLHPSIGPPVVIDSGIATSFSFVEDVVEEAVGVVMEDLRGAVSAESALSMEVLPSELKSLVEVEELLEEELEADMDLQEEMRLEEVISTSMSNRVITNTPSSTVSAPAVVGTFPDGDVEMSNCGESCDGQRVELAKGIILGVIEDVDSGENVPTISSLLPRPSVRTRPPFGSPSTVDSGSSPLVARSEAPKLMDPPSLFAPGGIFPFIFTKSRDSVTSSFTNSGGFSSFGFSSKGPATGSSIVTVANISSSTTTMSKSFSVACADGRSEVSQAVTSSGDASRHGEAVAGVPQSYVPKNTATTSPNTTPDSPASLNVYVGGKTYSFTSKVRLFFQRLAGRTHDRRSKKVRSRPMPPAVAIDRSEFELSMGGGNSFPASASRVLGWDGGPVKPKGTLA